MYKAPCFAYMPGRPYVGHIAAADGDAMVVVRLLTAVHCNMAEMYTTTE